MKAFTVEELLLLHFKIIRDFGGSDGVRDEGRLHSAIAAPWQEAFGMPLYETKQFTSRPLFTFVQSLLITHLLMGTSVRQLH